MSDPVELSARALAWKRFLAERGWLNKGQIKPPDGYFLLLIFAGDGFSLAANLRAEPSKPLIEEGEFVSGQGGLDVLPRQTEWFLWEDIVSVRLVRSGE